MVGRGRRRGGAGSDERWTRSGGRGARAGRAANEELGDGRDRAGRDRAGWDREGWGGVGREPDELDGMWTSGGRGAVGGTSGGRDKERKQRAMDCCAILAHRCG